MDREVVSRILAPKIQRWKKMNEDFKRFEVKGDIARFFALSFDGQSFEEVYKELQRAKKQGAYIISTELFIDRIMLSKLKYEWGEDVYEMIKECF